MSHRSTVTGYLEGYMEKRAAQSVNPLYLALVEHMLSNGSRFPVGGYDPRYLGTSGFDPGWWGAPGVDWRGAREPYLGSPTFGRGDWARAFQPRTLGGRPGGSSSRSSKTDSKFSELASDMMNPWAGAKKLMSAADPWAGARKLVSAINSGKLTGRNS